VQKQGEEKGRGQMFDPQLKFDKLSCCIYVEFSCIFWHASSFTSHMMWVFHLRYFVCWQAKMSRLWQMVSISASDEDLSSTLRELLQAMRNSPDFPAEARHRLLDLLHESHEPAVWLQVCTLLGMMCNASSTASNELARYGMLSCLASMLNKSFGSMAYVTPSSERGRLYGQLVQFAVSMLRLFARTSSLCVRKLVDGYVLDTVLSAVDYSLPALYAPGTAETKNRLESLTLGQSLVGWRMPSQSDAKTVYQPLLGCDMPDITGPYVVFGDSFVVDLYNTNEDNDVHIVEELVSSSSDSSVWESVSDGNGEWVDVYIAHVLDGAHFVAVFGPENLACFQHLREAVEAAVANHSASLIDLPSPGQLVCVAHPTLGSFRAYVVKVNGNSEILTFAPDCSYVVEVPLSYLKILEDCSLPLPAHPLIHVCKIFG